MEWLVTNGIGGYASGPAAGPPTRRYHGLLVAALHPPLGRTVLVTRFEEKLDGRPVPAGRFHLDGSIPTWRWEVGGGLIEKTIWMEHGKNTTYIDYRHARGERPIRLDLEAFVTCRSHHETLTTADLPLRSDMFFRGVRISGETEYFLLSDADATLRNEWDPPKPLAMEAFRGLDDSDTDFHAADLSLTLDPGHSITIAATTDPVADLEDALSRRRSREPALLAAVPPSDKVAKRLVLAADQFIVARATEGKPGSTVIAGYHWFADWGRDTMISLPGLCLETGRHDEAAQILRTFARFVDRGMIPNHFPEDGPPEYNTVDATLWYIEALRAFHRAAPDNGLVRELFPVLENIIEWHERGTRHGIGVDPDDGLLAAGQPGTQLTWMDARVGGREITPRIGKPVEINALWFQALRTMAGFSAQVGADPDRYAHAADEVAGSFQRFHNSETGYLFDVIDGTNGNDPSLRPNQLFAASLSDSPLDPAWQRAVVDSCTEQLLTPMGLRTLAPFEPGYQGRYGGGPAQRDGAYHQGTVWPWLIGPYAFAHLRVYNDPATIRRLIGPLIAHLMNHGTVTECAEGDPPHEPRAAIAQAWSVAELLRVWRRVGTGQVSE